MFCINNEKRKKESSLILRKAKFQAIFEFVLSSASGRAGGGKYNRISAFVSMFVLLIRRSLEKFFQKNFRDDSLFCFGFAKVKILSFLRLRGASGAQGISTSASCLEAHKRRFIFNPWILHFAFAQPLKMTALAFLLFLNLSTSYAGECLPGECKSRFTSCTCNDDGKLIESIQSDGVNYKTVTIYDGAGHVTYDVSYNSAEAITEDKPDNKYVYTYDGNGNITSSAFYNTAEEISADKPGAKCVYNYDSNGSMIDMITYNYKGDFTVAKCGLEHCADQNDIDEFAHTEYTYAADGTPLTVKTVGKWGSFISEENCTEQTCPAAEISVVCAIGYTEGCVAGEVTLADGSKVMMQNGQIVGGDEVDESSCYANGQVFWDNTCVNEYPFARKRWTPAEASKWLHDGNDNFVIITFKK